MQVQAALWVPFGRFVPKHTENTSQPASQQPCRNWHQTTYRRRELDIANWTIAVRAAEGLYLQAKHTHTHTHTHTSSAQEALLCAVPKHIFCAGEQRICNKLTAAGQWAASGQNTHLDKAHCCRTAQTRGKADLQGAASGPQSSASPRPHLLHGTEALTAACTAKPGAHQCTSR